MASHTLPRWSDPAIIGERAFRKRSLGGINGSGLVEGGDGIAQVRDVPSFGEASDDRRQPLAREARPLVVAVFRPMAEEARCRPELQHQCSLPVRDVEGPFEFGLDLVRRGTERRQEQRVQPTGLRLPQADAVICRESPVGRGQPGAGVPGHHAGLEEHAHQVGTHPWRGIALIRFLQGALECGRRQPPSGRRGRRRSQHVASVVICVGLVPSVSRPAVSIAAYRADTFIVAHLQRQHHGEDEHDRRG